MAHKLQPDHPSGVAPLRLLFIDNALTDYALLVRFIELGGYTTQSLRVENAAQMREALGGSHWDMVISELDLPGFPLADVLTVLRETAFATPLVVVTHAGDDDAEMAALAAGADDYVSKSRLTRLVPALKRCLAAAAARDMHGMVGELITVLASDVNWLAGNVTGHEASGRIQNLQRVLEGAQARAAHHMRVLQPPRPIYK